MEMYAPEKPARTRHRRPARKINQSSVSHVEFKPIELIVGAKWYVRARLGPGRRLYIRGFTTESEAKEWIVDQSTAWLRDILLHTNCFPAAPGKERIDAQPASVRKEALGTRELSLG